MAFKESISTQLHVSKFNDNINFNFNKLAEI